MSNKNQCHSSNRYKHFTDFCSVISTAIQAIEPEEVAREILDGILTDADSLNVEEAYESLADDLGGSTSQSGLNEFIEALNEIAIAQAAACSSSDILNVTELARDFANAFSLELTDENLQEIRMIFGEILCAESMEQDSDPSPSGTVCPPRGNCTCPPDGINSILTCSCEFFACLDPGDHLGPIFGISGGMQRCLAFIVDTTGSKGAEIDVVRTIILDFLRSEEDLNELRCYVLVPFNDNGLVSNSKQHMNYKCTY